MSDSSPAFTTEEIFPLAQANANLFLFSTLSFLKERGIPIQEWTSFLSTQLAPRWKSRRTFKAMEIATLVGRNLVSGGATLVRLDGDDDRAEVMLEWDVQPYINAFEPLTLDDFAHMLHFYGAITERMGYGYHCEWKNPIISITISRQGSVSG